MVRGLGERVQGHAELGERGRRESDPLGGQACDVDRDAHQAILSFRARRARRGGPVGPAVRVAAGGPARRPDE
ncbi:hypothetical protein Snoj_74100 [Streptomyces nojiriensis]|uniref:Uncharacterized protein n=1 Tax=Streptomyces nojiriensis TaxID=66374 RepID=A0ABQ3SZE8_9ACTN|nr:hypothetical protein GCM10010205_56500 [Streptomyces nojiriensis]GHI73492.1 hypothetical protein Snoj_74100 [Streptomyces nojiriensis]